jgi:hypothetical protein
MKMQMLYALPSVDAGIDNNAKTALVNAESPRYLAHLAHYVFHRVPDLPS